MGKKTIMLEIRLLGMFDVKYKGKGISIASRPAQLLFAYLVLSPGKSHRREKLAGVFWPDSLEQTARENLRHALWRLKKALGSQVADRYIQTDDLSIKFDVSTEYQLDTAILEALDESSTADESIAALANYQGELLPGFYEEWVVLEREHLYSMFEHHMARLLSLLEKEKRWLDILDWAERWIKLGQKPEPAYRALMTAHAAKGDMSKVVATYERCLNSLREWGLEPSEQTKALLDDLKSGAPSATLVARTSLPSGIVTFLFTDIEASTRLWEQHPKAMRAALARHDSLLQNIIEGNGGYIIKRTGDGLHAVFPHPKESVATTLACQQALMKETWDELPNPLRVRMALHTGEAQLRSGDYFGTVVNRAARLMSLASGGQILVSSSTAELVRDQLPPGATLQDLGEHRLKDIARPQRVYQLVGPDLPTEFLPLHPLNTTPNNLIFPVTSFIGREREMADVTELLGKTRLLTLTGPGGTGKTRLSLEVASEMLDTFPDGVWIVELAPLTDPALASQAVASLWNLREQSGRPLLDMLVDYLRAKTLLLILDNCEHLINACAELVTAWLRACPKLKILTSSREALGVSGETTYHVPSLSLVDVASDATPEALLQSESARLFVERARAVDLHFALTPQNVQSVAQICQRLDGIPLALELAAARVRLLSVDQIAARLDDRFSLLKDGSRTALPRHQTLIALIDWSYDLLNEVERRALAHISVFAGGWTVEAAETVLGTDGLDLLSSLVDKSLVITEEIESGEKRYNLLETIRQYAREKLRASGELSRARELHLQYYLDLAADAEPRLLGPQMLDVLNRLEPELDNIRAALEWALEHDTEVALQLAANLVYFWQGRGHITEGRRWLSKALSQSDEYMKQSLKAKALWSIGVLIFAQGELIAARAALTESTRLAREAGEPKTLVMASCMLGFTVLWMGDATTAEAVIEEGMHVAQNINHEFGKGLMLMVRANQAMDFQHDFTAARAYGEESLRIMREVGNPFFTAIAVMGLGSVALAQDNYAEARALLEESKKLFDELGDRHMAIGVQSDLAHIERQLGNHTQAVKLYHQSILTWQELGHRVSIAHEFECLAFIAGAQSQWERATCLLGAAENLREELNSPMTATEQTEYDRNVSALRAQMDETAFVAAWADGRKWTVEQAIEFVFKETQT